LLSLMNDSVNPVAEFYAGYIHRTVGIHMGRELNECMERDDDVTLMWEHAISNIYKDKQAWNSYREEALGESMPLLEACNDVGKFKVASAEIEAWWTGFFKQEDALGTINHNFKMHPLRAMAEMALIRIQWELGFYRAAGRSYGRFDRLLMGRPEWNAMPAIEAPQVKAEGRGQDLVTFQAYGFDAMWGFDLRKDIMKCVTPDDIEFDLMDAAIKALNPYDEVAWRKYFETTQTMDKFNWAPCMENKEIKEATDSIGKEWISFWTQDKID